MRIITILVACLIAFVAVSQTTEAAKKPQPAAPKPIYAAPMRVVIVRNSSPKCEPRCPQWIDAEGEITSATPQAFTRVFKQMGKAKLPIIIRSPGGSIEAALQIGKMIRQRGLTVAVGYTRFSGCSPADKTCKLPPENKGIYNGTIEEEQAFCNSACPMLMAGGTTRLASYLASVGVHQPRTTWMRQTIRYREFYRIVKGKKKVISRKEVGRVNLKDKVTYGLDKRLRKTLTAYYSSMGIDLAILEETTKATFNDMNFLSEEKIDKLRLRTTPMRARYFDAPSLCGTMPTSAVCIEDKTKDPAKISLHVAKGLGLDSKTVPMTFRLARRQDASCTSSCPVWVAAEGAIVADTVAQFSSFLKIQNLPPVAVVLDSPGGDALAAMEMGRIIRRAGLETVVGRSVFATPVAQEASLRQKQQMALFSVDGKCNGTCMLVYAGGKYRHAGREASISLHHPSLYNSKTDSSVATKMNLYLSEMGIKPALLARMYEIKGKTAMVLHQSNLIDVSLATDEKTLSDILSTEKCKQRLWEFSCLAPDT